MGVRLHRGDHLKPRLLDLFCGAGGAARGYADAGFEVVGVDVVAQPNYPYTFVLADALTFLEFGHDSANGGWYGAGAQSFDAVHASPPCQRWSSKTAEPATHPDLITPLRPLLEATGLPYVIENVLAAPLRRDLILCGSSFGLRVRRHRVFESNMPLLGPDCDHAWQDADKRFRLYDHGKWFQSGIVHVFGTGGGKGREHWAEAMGIDWMRPAELAEAIPPSFTEFIGAQLLAHLKAQVAA